MKPYSLFFAVGLAVNAVVAPAAERTELLVKWKAGPGSEEARAGNARVGATVVKNFEEVGWQLVRLREGVGAAEGLAKFRSDSNVALVEVNAAVQFRPPPPQVDEGAVPKLAAQSTGFIPNDPRWSSLWNMRKIGMPAAWQVTKGDSNVVVAVLDSGVDYTHEDLRDSMWRNPGETGTDEEGKDKATNQVDDDGNGYVDDVFGIDPFGEDSDPMDEGAGTIGYHGTGCAGIVAAGLNNSTGMAGVAGAARVMAVRIFGQDNGSETPAHQSMTGIIEAFNYLIQQKRRGVNLRVASNSWGWVTKSAALDDALQIVEEEGILLVFAAGNDGVPNDENWWTVIGDDYANVISVAAADSSDVRPSFSNWGQSSVDLAAPGVNVPTLRTNRSYITDFTGTSGACPHVAGAAALLLAVKPEATVLELKAVLMQSVDPIAGWRGRIASNGRLNVARALEVLTNTALPAVVASAAPRGPHTKEDAEVRLYFSAPMNRASVESGLVFNPAVVGTVSWNEESTVLTMKPSGPLVRTNYQARLLGTASDAEGRTIDGDFDRTSEGSPADDFVWGFRFAPPNDDFAGALMLSGTTGTNRSSTTNTTMELDEPLITDKDNRTGAATLWYQWRAAEDGWMTFDTSVGSTLDTLVAVYTGSELTSLEQVGYSEAFGTRTGARVSLPVKAGTNYFICVAGQSYYGPLTGYIGAFTLSWYPTPVPAFTLAQFNPKIALPGGTVTLFGTNFTGATEVLFNGVPATFTTGVSSNMDLRLIATVPAGVLDGPISVSTPYGNLTSTALFSVLVPRLQVSGTNGVAVSWGATTPIIRLQTKAALGNQEWTEVQSGLEKIDGRTYVRPTMTERERYYRLIK